MECLWPLQYESVLGVEPSAAAQSGSRGEKCRADSNYLQAADSPVLQRPRTQHSTATELRQKHIASKPKTSEGKTKGQQKKKRHQLRNALEEVEPSSVSEAETSATSDEDALHQSQAKDDNAHSTDSVHSQDTGHSEDSIHTAHFSDEGELSDMDAEAASAQAASAKKQKTGPGPTILYQGPNSNQLAAAEAAAKPPAGPRPLLGDVLSEVVHSADVRRSSQATGVPDEPVKQDNWQCIMRHNNDDGCVFYHRRNVSANHDLHPALLNSCYVVFCMSSG